MANTATLTIEKSNPEKEAWELFEVGSYEEVISLADSHPDSHFLFHLSLISRIENGETVKNHTPKGMSLLSPMVEAYANRDLGKWVDASNQLEIYYKNKNALISYPFTKISWEVFLKSGKKELALGILRIYKKKFMDLAFIKEEAILNYELKKYNDVVELYSHHPREMNDAELHRVIGMSLLFLGKNKDAESILEKIPGKLNLPSFEEKRKEYQVVYSKLNEYEAKRNELSLRDLEDLGFAYLFHSEFAKAESVFRDLSRQLTR